MPDRLTHWKEQLLDLTKGNRLLNFKESRGRTLLIRYPDPQTLFTRLAHQAKPVTFPSYASLRQRLSGDLLEYLELCLGDQEAEAHQAGRQAEARPADFDPMQFPEELLDECLRAGEVVTSRRDTETQRVLNALRLRAKASLEEEGVNTLFVTFGMLRWRELDNSYTSPLVLVPVQLRRRSVEDPFTLTPLDEETVLNPTLALKLAQDHGVHLPEVPEEPSDETLAELLESVAERCQQKGWSVSESAYLGLFSFLKLVMYRDLEAHETAARQHPVVRAFLGETARVAQPEVTPPEPHLLDSCLAPEDCFEVLPADSSQQAAIRAAVSGQSFILQGPPGTGKSQTIGNIIAECLARNKSVLFVAEKMAALEVVHERLKECQLHPFCLEVHSYKTNKKDVIRELGKAMSLRLDQDREAAAFEWAQYAESRDRLNGYLAALHTPVSGLVWTPYQVHGRLAALADAPSRPFLLEGASVVTRQEWDAALALLDQLEANRSVLERYEDHPWNGCLLDAWSLRAQNEVAAQLRELTELLSELDEAGGELANACGLRMPQSLPELEVLLDRAERALCTPHPPASWFEVDSLGPLIAQAQEWQAVQAQYNDTRDALLAKFREGILSLPIGELLATLDTRHRETLSQLSPVDGSAEDRAIRDADQLGTHLGQIAELTLSIRRELPEACSLCSEPVPSSLREVHDWLQTAELLSRDPRPEQEWFDRARLLDLRDEAARAEGAYAREAQLRGEVLSRYRDSLLSEDLKGLLQRYEALYGTVFRWLKPGYWRDRNRLRRHRLASERTIYEGELADLRQATLLLDTTQWIEASRAYHVACFGRHFTGRDTNWSRLRTGLEDTLKLIDRMPSQRIPDHLQAFLLASGASVAALRDSTERLSSAIGSLSDELLELSQVLTFKGLPGRPGGWGAQAPSEVEAWAKRMLQAVQEIRSAAETLTRYHQGPEVPSQAELVQALRQAEQVQAAEEKLRQYEERLLQDFGGLFRGMETSWDGVLQALDWAGRVIGAFEPEPVPPSHVARITDPGFPGPGIREQAELVRQSLTRSELGFGGLSMLFEPGVLTNQGRGFRDWPWTAQIEWLTHRLEHLDDLQSWIDFRRAARPCWDGLLRGLIVDLVNNPTRARSAPRDTFLRRFYETWLDEVGQQVPALGHFRRAAHEQDLDRFERMDRELRRANQARVRQHAFGERPLLGEVWRQSEVGILQTEVAKSRRHKPLRRLFSEIRGLLPALKPCLMMSPLSVAKFLEPGVHRFDVVIFDEASQIGPEDAIGSILRGSQLIVAGDRRQLPPTRFFSSSSSSAVDQDDDEAYDDEPLIESVLDECERCGLPRYPLRWHYRSLKESLIAFSNQHFYAPYAEELVTFPAADESDQSTGGVRWEYVPDGLYQPKPRNVNLQEAERVVDLVFDQLRRHPKESLGVIALSEAQQLEIIAALERRLWQDPSLPNPHEEEGEDSFFVTNLESVQGHERDAIILCIGYGPTERDSAGRASRVSLNFGPINRAGGERRLNVAVTRAKRRLFLVSSLQPEEIDLRRATSEGARLLKEYMHYVRDRRFLRGQDPPYGSDSQYHLESAVRQALMALPELVAAGHSVGGPIGNSYFPLELAVTRPNSNDGYMLGLLFDGSVPQKMPTARDREILRPSELRRRGWTLHRTWSPEWTRHRELEQRRILELLASEPAAGGGVSQTAQAELGAPRTVWQEQDGDGSAEDVSTVELDGVVPYEETPRKWLGRADAFYRIGLGAIAERLVEVTLHEGPIELHEAARRVAASWQMQRVGSRILRRVRDAYVFQRRRMGLIELREDFLWPKDMERPPVRVPAPDGVRRTIDQIAIEELAEAILVVLRANVGLLSDDLVRSTARLLGFEHTGGVIAARLRTALQFLESAGRVQVEAGWVRATGS